MRFKTKNKKRRAKLKPIAAKCFKLLNLAKICIASSDAILDGDRVLLFTPIQATSQGRTVRVQVVCMIIMFHGFALRFFAVSTDHASVSLHQSIYSGVGCAFSYFFFCQIGFVLPRLSGDHESWVPFWWALPVKAACCCCCCSICVYVAKKLDLDGNCNYTHIRTHAHTHTHTQKHPGTGPGFTAEKNEWQSKKKRQMIVKNGQRFHAL